MGISIQFSSFEIVLMTKINYLFGRFSISSAESIICFSYIYHIFTMTFLKFKKGIQKFANLQKTISTELDTIQRSSRRFFSINVDDPTKDTYDPIYERFFYAMDIQIHAITLGLTSISRNSFTDKKTSISIDQSSEIDNVVTSNFANIDQCISSSHLKPHVKITSNSNISINYSHAERLNEWTLEKEMRKSEPNRNIGRMDRRICPAC